MGTDLDVGEIFESEERTLDLKNDTGERVYTIRGMKGEGTFRSEGR